MHRIDFSPLIAFLPMSNHEQDGRRAALEFRWRDIADQLAAINEGKTMPENPAELEGRLMDEQLEIEFLLGHDYAGPDDETVEE
jgi:hypothetical protein